MFTRWERRVKGRAERNIARPQNYYFLNVNLIKNMKRI